MISSCYMNRFFLPLLPFLFLIPSQALAHVGYLIPLEAGVWQEQNTTVWWNVFLDEGLWMALAILLVIAAVVFLTRQTWTPLWRTVGKRAETYIPFVPWILRLSLGIALLAAGTQGYLLSPVIPAPDSLAFLEVVLGFCFLAGFALAPASILLLGIWFVALPSHLYLLGNMEIPAACLALLVLANGRPGVDDLLGLRFFSWAERWKSVAPFLLRVGIGGSMLFLAVLEKWMHVPASAAVVELYELKEVIPVQTTTWVYGAGAVELLVGLATMLGVIPRVISLIALGVLTLSFFYFGEDVTSHVTLFGILTAIFIYGQRKTV